MSISEALPTSRLQRSKRGASLARLMRSQVVSYTYGLAQRVLPDEMR